MNILIYFIIFCMGTVFGSFLTLATYRIPLDQDITHKRSYCPNCNHRLSFLDMIPLLSYIFLGAKCRYCKKKISPRYFIIELLTGVAFALLAMMLGLDVYNFNYVTVIEFIFGILYIVFIFLIAGIDIEHGKIDKRVLIYGISISIMRIVYQYIMCTNNCQEYNINRIIIYLIAIIIINIFSIQSKNNKYDYAYGLIITAIIMSFFTYEITTILTVICTLLIVAIKILLYKTVNKNKKKDIKLPIAFYMSASNAIIIFISYMYFLGR